ncbi:MAG: MoxR family ATPase [Bacteroidota bacterium]
MQEERRFENRVALDEIRSAVEKVRLEVQKIMVGQHALIDALLAAVLANGHVLIEGVPGVAKTLAAKLLARTLDVGFARIQFTPDLMPSDILGTAIFNPKTTAFEFKAGPIFSNMILIDEVNRAPAKTQSAMFEVMEERQVTMDGVTHKMKQPFLVFATQNPIEHEGTYRLPEAQLDRFLFKLNVGYPSMDEEAQMLAGHHAGRTGQDLSNVKPVVSASQLVAFQQTVRSLHIEPRLLRYITEVVQATRNHEALYLGASPRASLAMMGAAKAFAAMGGRDFVTPEDVQQTAVPVLQHRIMLTPDQEMEGATPAQVVERLISKIEVPR